MQRREICFRRVGGVGGRARGAECKFLEQFPQLLSTIVLFAKRGGRERKP
jgi:hypothetical protein